VINQRTQTTRTQTQTQPQPRARQPSQQPSSLLPPLAYLMRQGDDIDVNAFNNDDSKKQSTTTVTTTAPSTSIPTSTRTRTDTAGTHTINLNKYVDEKMIEDLQNQHLQMMQM